MADKTARPRKEAERTDVSGGIMDITDTPDVAVWSNEIRSNVRRPSDKVREPSRVASTILHAEQNKLTIDPADKKQVARAIASVTSLTDESDLA
ncbi:MAG TPA: hypothetical protein VHK86_02435 [Nitrososphaera sp.]|jgi:hypothetical protein|nr:hypothetical protein [Nitrososphaera sp.]